MRSLEKTIHARRLVPLFLSAALLCAAVPPLVPAQEVPQQEAPAAASMAPPAVQEAPPVPLVSTPGLPPLASPATWSALAHDPPWMPPSLAIAYQALLPSEAGYPFVQQEWAGPTIGAGPEFRSLIKPVDIQPSIFAGYARKGLFAGLRLAAGAVFSTKSALMPFAGADVAGYYLQNSGFAASGGLFAGLAGAFALPSDLSLPWALVARAAFRAPAVLPPRAELVAELASPTIYAGNFGRFKAALALGVDVAGVINPYAQMIGRFTLDFEGRHYIGALYTGLAAHVSFDGGWNPNENQAQGFLLAQAKGGWRYARFGGLGASMSMGFASAPTLGWGRPLRLAGDNNAQKGDIGMSLGLEFPFLFAKGTLFKLRTFDVEFLLTPFAELFLLRASEASAFFDAGSLQIDFGVELAMALDHDRRQTFKVGLGFDVSPLIQQLPDMDFMGCFAACAAISVVF